MKTLVIYSSRNGNTSLVADAIADELDCPRIKLTKPDFEDIDLKDIDTVFLGSGIYGGTLHKDILDFGKYLNSCRIKRTLPLKIAFFITWLGRGKSDLSGINHFRGILQSGDFYIQDDYYRCYGESFKFIRKNHPDKNDLINAKEWAEKTASPKKIRE